MRHITRANEPQQRLLAYVHVADAHYARVDDAKEERTLNAYLPPSFRQASTHSDGEVDEGWACQGCKQSGRIFNPGHKE